MDRLSPVCHPHSQLPCVPIERLTTSSANLTQILNCSVLLVRSARALINFPKAGNPGFVASEELSREEWLVGNSAESRELRSKQGQILHKLIENIISQDGRSSSNLH